MITFGGDICAPEEELFAPASHLIKSASQDENSEPVSAEKGIDDLCCARCGNLSETNTRESEVLPPHPSIRDYKLERDFEMGSAILSAPERPPIRLS